MKRQFLYGEQDPILWWVQSMAGLLSTACIGALLIRSLIF